MKSCRFAISGLAAIALLLGCEAGTRNAVDPTPETAASAIEAPDLSGGDSTANLRAHDTG